MAIVFVNENIVYRDGVWLDRHSTTVCGRSGGGRVKVDWMDGWMDGALFWVSLWGYCWGAKEKLPIWEL